MRQSTRLVNDYSSRQCIYFPEKAQCVDGGPAYLVHPFSFFRVIFYVTLASLFRLGPEIKWF